MTRPVVNLTGTEEVIKALRKIGAKADAAIEAAVKGAAQDIRSRAQFAIAKPPKTGIIYTNKKKGRSHRASAPGEAPATDTGRLRQTIIANLSGKTAEVIANAEYAAALEFGTKNMEPRPFMVPAMEATRPSFNRALSKIISNQGGEE